MKKTKARNYNRKILGDIPENWQNWNNKLCTEHRLMFLRNAINIRNTKFGHISQQYLSMLLGFERSVLSRIEACDLQYCTGSSFLRFYYVMDRYKNASIDDINRLFPGYRLNRHQKIQRLELRIYDLEQELKEVWKVIREREKKI